MNDAERDALLIELRTQVSDLVHLIKGNGQEGVYPKVIRMESEVESLKESVPSSKERKAAWITVIVTLITAVAGVIEGKLN